MNEILSFLLNHASFLYKEFGCKFVDSDVSRSFGNAFLILTTEKIRFRMVRDRGQLRGDFQAVADSSKTRWYSIDIVRKQLTGEDSYFTDLDAGNAAFLRNHFREVEELFSESCLPDTHKKLHKLESERAKKLFG